MDFYERFGKLLSEKIDSVEFEVADEKTEPDKTKTFGDVTSASTLLKESKNQAKDVPIAKIAREYVEDVPVKLAR